MKLIPLSDNVVIKPDGDDQDEKVTGAGIIVPGHLANQGRRTEVGTVIEAGPGRTENGILIPTGVKKDDRIIYWSDGSVEVNIDGVDYINTRATAIVGVLED